LPGEVPSEARDEAAANEEFAEIDRAERNKTVKREA